MSDSCTVTNNTGGSVAILTPVQSTSPNLSQLGTVLNNMEVCKLSTGSSILNGATATVTLDETYLGSNNQTQTATSYDLVACETVWYQPVASVSIDNTSSSFSSQTLSLAKNTVMKDTATFLQYIAAYPGSKMTQLYTAALQSAQNAGNAAVNSSGSSASGSSSSDPTGAVSAFFASTQNFQDVTIDSVASMQAYYQSFPCVWAEYKSNVTYYLYAAASGGANTDFVGTITLTLSGSKLDLTKANAGYTCTFTPAKNPSDLTSVNVDSSKALNLTYANGQFSDAVNAPHVAVSGLFQLLSTFTQKPSDNSIITVLTGTIYDQTVMGFDTSQATQAAQAQPILDFSNPAATFNSVLEIGSAFQTLFAMGDLINRVRNWVNKRNKRLAAEQKNKQSQDDVKNDDTLTSEEKSAELSKLDAQDSVWDEESESDITQLRKSVSASETQLNDNLKKLSPSKATDPKELPEVDGNLKAASQINQFKQMNKANGEKLEAAVKGGASEMSPQQLQKVEQAAADVKATDAKLANPGSLDQIQSAVKQLKAEVASNVQEIDGVVSGIEAQLGESTNAQINQYKQTTDEATKNMDELEDESTEISEGSKSGDADPLVAGEVHVEAV